MNKRTIMIILFGIGVMAILAIIIIPRLMNQQATNVATYWPTNGWQTSTPEEQGLDSEKLARAMQIIKDQNIKINSLLIIRNGYVVLDTYFYNPYDGTYPHDMASVTKSVMTTLIGIAVSQGKLNLDQQVLSFFPELTIANMDSRKEHLTVRHLVGMVNGFESGCLADDLGTIARMKSGSEDWVLNTLNRKMVAEPGKSFCYDSPGMHLLSAILQKSTGMSALDYAQRYLFGPLGIKDAIWDTDLQGRNYGGGDLHIYPQDAAKIGYLFLNNGMWDGVQVVPAEWVKQATRQQSDAGGDGYGYGWWISETSYGARGREGQNIIIVPSINAIVVTTGGGFEYDQIDPYLSASVIDPINPLPANSEGVANLQAILDSFVGQPAALPASSPANAAQVVSGNSYTIEPNPVGITAIKFDFSEAEAIITMQRKGGDMILRVGLDNVFRPSTDGSQCRGYWKDPQTFIIEKFDIGFTTIQIAFNNNRLDVETSGLKLTGHLQGL